MRNTCFGNLGWFEEINRRCKHCGEQLFEACNHVRFCLYCEWYEPDEIRIRRLARLRLND